MVVEDQTVELTPAHQANPAVAAVAVRKAHIVVGVKVVVRMIELAEAYLVIASVARSKPSVFRSHSPL